MDDESGTLQRPARPPDRTEVTGPLTTDVYDVWEPAPARARGITVALVHGGFWRERYDRTHLGPLAEALARDGFHAVSLEYPRVGMPDGGWPGTGAAVLAQVEAVRTDPDLPGRVVVVGHSAGGHLALWLASGGRAAWLAGVIALAPAADLGEVDRLGLSDGAARALLGSAPADAPENWADADPARQQLGVPTVILTGDADDVMPTSVVDRYLATRRADEPLHTAVARGADHLDLVDPASSAYLLLLAEVEELTLRPH
ncbi:MAG: alpha/beta hydrolase family protein [Dermatophilaceae bacterium]